MHGHDKFLQMVLGFVHELLVNFFIYAKVVDILMFQQFKNIFPNATLNIRSITESVGLNDTEWNRGVERLGALRSEFQNLNSIFSNRQDSSSSISTPSNTIESSMMTKDLKATARMIDKLQEGWDSIQKSNQDNFEKARAADVKLRQLQATGELHFKVCETMENANTEFKEIHSSLETIQSSAANLMHVLEKLEGQIDQVSVDYEKREFELWKEEQEKELMDEIANRRLLLREKEIKLKQQYEEYDSIQKQKKVELYEANFNAELEDYRRRRETEVSSLYSHQSNTASDATATLLDQLKLQETGEGLDQFLDDSAEPMPSGTKTKTKKKEKSKPKPKPIPQPVYSSDDEDDDGKIEILADEDYEDL